MKARIARWTGRLRRAFNLPLLLALFLGMGTGLVVVNMILMFSAIRGHFSEVCDAARGAYEHGGPESLRSVLQGAEVGPGVRVHLLDAAGRDLTTGQYRSALISQAQGFLIPTLIVTTATYSCVAEPPAQSSPIPFGPMLWVLPFVSVLCCTVGAYVTWRMRRIEAAVNHFGAGDCGLAGFHWEAGWGIQSHGGTDRIAGRISPAALRRYGARAALPVDAVAAGNPRGAVRRRRSAGSDRNGGQPRERPG
jgi:hypothetical protein